MILASFCRPHSLFLRSRLLLSTALIGVGALMPPSGARAQEFADENSLYFDNTNPGIEGPLVVLWPESGEWGDDAEIWRERDAAGSWSLPGGMRTDKYGILTRGAFGQDVEITLTGDDKTLRGLQMRDGKYKITGGFLSGTGTPENTFVLDNQSDANGPAYDFTIGSDLGGNVEIEGSGAGTGAVIYEGDTTLGSGDKRLEEIQVRQNALFKLTGRIEGQVVNAGQTIFENAEKDADDKAVHNGIFINGGEDSDVEARLTIDGYAQIDVLQNNHNGIVDILDAESELTAGTDESAQGVLNSGTINLAGTIRSPEVLNSQDGILNLKDPNPWVTGDGPTVEGRLLNLGTIAVDDWETVTLTINEYGNPDANPGSGVFVNEGIAGKFALGQNSNLTINASRFEFQSQSDLTVGHNLILNGEIYNRGELTYWTAEDEDLGLNGDIINASGQDDLGNPMRGDLYVESSVDAKGHEIENSGNFFVRKERNDEGNVGQKTGKIESIGKLTNSGTLSVIEAGSLEVDGEFFNERDGMVEVASEGRIDAEKLHNNGNMKVDVGSNVEVSDRFDQEGHGVLNINGGKLSATDLDGSGVLDNAGEININVTDDTRGSVIGDTITNRKVINVSGDLTAVKLANEQNAKIIVDGGGMVDAARMDNRGTVEINVTDGAIGVVESDVITNENLIDVYGSLTAKELLINRSDGRLRVYSGATVAAKEFNNLGILNLAEGGIVTSAELLNSKTITVSGNLSSSELLVSFEGGLIDVRGIGAVETADLRNNGELNVADNATVTVMDQLSNSGGLNVTDNAAVTVADRFINIGELNVADNATVTGTSQLTNSGALAVVDDAAVAITDLLVNSASAEVTVDGGTLTSERFRNEGTLAVNHNESDDNTGSVTANLEFNNSKNGVVNVNGGFLTVADDAGILGELKNSGEINVLESGNTAESKQGVVLVDTLSNTGEINVDSKLTAVTSLTNNVKGVVNLDGGVLRTAEFITRSDSELILSGGRLAIRDADNNLGDLTNSGTILVNEDSGAAANIVAATLTNDEGAIDVRGTLTGVAQLVNKSGTISVSGRLYAGDQFHNSSEKNKDEFAARVELDGGLLAANDLIDNSGEMSGTGTLRGELNNSGNFNLTNATLIAPTVTNSAGGYLSLTGESKAHGLSNGIVQILNEGDMVLDASVLGNVTNYATLTAAGSISGKLLNSGEMTVDQGRTLELTDGSVEAVNRGTMGIQGELIIADSLTNHRDLNIDGGTIKGSVDNLRRMRLGTGGTVEGKVTNSHRLTLSGGTVDGHVTNSSSGILNGNGKITGELTQDGTLDVQAGNSLEVGSLKNSGTANLSGTLTSVGVVKNSGTLNLSGTLISSENVTNEVDGKLNLDGATINLLPNGLAAEGAGRFLTNLGTIDVRSDSNILGNLTNNGLINVNRNNVQNTLEVSGQFTNNSVVRVDGNGSTLKIIAEWIALGLDSEVSGRVDLVGNLVNSGALNYNMPSELEGSLLNEVAGTVGVTSTLNGNNNDIINRGALNVGNGGEIAELKSITNQGSGSFAIAEGGVVEATDVRNEASMTIAGKLITNSVRGLLNTGDATLSGTLDGNLTNRGDVTLSGKMDGELTNRGGDVVFSGGTIQGNVLNEDTSTGSGNLSGIVTITGLLNNRSEATLAGSVQDVSNSGILKTDGDLRIGALVNNRNSRVEVLAGHQLTTESAFESSGRAVVAGTLDADVENRQRGNLAMDGGIVEGNVTNRGIVSGAGTITGELAQEAGSTLSLGGELSVASLVNKGFVDVTDGSSLILTSADAADNQSKIKIQGTFDGDIVNNGVYTLTGTHKGSLTSIGYSDIGGLITGNVTYQGSGKDSVMTFSDGGKVAGRLFLERDFAIGKGKEVDAGTIVVRRDRDEDGSIIGHTLDLAGAALGHVDNKGIVKAADGARIGGHLTNDGLVDLASNKKVGDQLAVGGGLSGKGVYALDISLSEMSSDSIKIEGGAATGVYDISLNYIGGTGVGDIGKSTVLIDVASEYGEQNDFDFNVRDSEIISDEKVVYLLGREVDTGDLVMSSNVNPHVGAIFGNVALTRSLIGAVVNRPTSPFVTGLAFDASEKPCGVGSWGRATGGSATVTGGTDNGEITVDSSVNANYYGMQAGTDFACFDNRFAGWSMSFGGFVGVNQGDTTQLLYSINPKTGAIVDDRVTSKNDVDFDQLYAGLYVTGTKGPFQFDLQYRHETTDFVANNTALLQGAGIGLTDEEFSSKGNTLSGSLSYTQPIGDKGWTFVPSIGFAYTRSETDTITFEGGEQLEFEDSETSIGFVSATIAKSFVQPKSNSAIYAFATGSFYKDFADPSVSIYTGSNKADSEPQRLTSDNLGSYGEISFGANYVKVLQPGPGLRPRQLSASARIDARSGGDLDSVGVTGQIRLQF